MKNKKYILALFIIVAILSISAVSAADDDSGSMISADDNQDLILEDIQEDVDTDDELIASNEQSKHNLEESNEDVVGESRTVETPSFTAIQNVVSDSNDGDTIYLKNQTYIGSGQDIVVGKSLTFIGNDTVLDANNQSGIFSILEGVHSITFKNIIFTNGYSGVYSSIYSRSDNINIINCSILNNSFNGFKSDVIINNSNANVTILNSIFENNIVGSNSFGLDAVLYIYSANTLIDECIFNNNNASLHPPNTHLSDSGFVIKCISDNIILKNSNITNNHNNWLGDTVSLHGQNINVSNSNFEGNDNLCVDEKWGGVLLLMNHDSLSNSIKIHWATAVFKVDNCTFKNNDLDTKMGMQRYVLGLDGARDSYEDLCYNFTLVNSVFENNKDGIWYEVCVDNSIISNCTFKDMDADYDAILLISNFTTLSDCTFENISKEGILLDGDNLDLKVYNSTFKNVGQGISCTSFVNNSLTVKDSGFINNTNGAIYGERLENCFIDNCDFINNSAEMGAAICLNDKGYVENGNTLISNCYFENNNATNYYSGGGAINVNNTGNTKTVIDNCIFMNNTAEKGGAIKLFADNTHITNCRFERNTATEGFAIYGGGDRKYNSIINCSFINHFTDDPSETASVFISVTNSLMANCWFENNTAPAAPACTFNGENNTISNCSFIKNSAINDYANCGALSVGGNNITLADCRFESNYVEGYHEDSGVNLLSGAATANANNMTIKNCSFINNYVKTNDKGVGGALSVSGENSILIDCEFFNNSVIGNPSGGGAIFVYSANNSAIVNCIFENNSIVGGNESLGGSAIYYQGNRVNYNYNYFIVNSTFLNNKAQSKYLNLTRSGTVLSLTLEGYGKYIHAISTGGVYVPGINLNFQNVSYWDGEMLNTDDVPVVENYMGSNQPIVFDFFDPRGNLVASITRMTDSNGQASFDYSELPDGVYTYVAYHPDNNYYSYIKGGEGSFVLRASFKDLQNKIDQATDSITLENDYLGPNSIYGIQINKNLTIYGNGHSLDAVGNGRIFRVKEGVSLTLIDVTLLNGYADNGGAILNDRGVVTIINSTLDNNLADGDGGAIFNYNGTLTIINSTLANGYAPNGGAVSNSGGIATIINSTFKNNYGITGNVIKTDIGENVILDNVKFVDNEGDNPIYAGTGEVDTSGVKTLTAVAFTIDDIADFLNGSSITINVAETIKGTEFNGNVTVSIGDNDFIIEVLNGIGSKTVTPNLAYGDYVAKLYFAETDVYDCASAQTNMFHVMNNPQISLSVANIQTGDSLTVKVNTIYTFNGALNVVINGVTYVVDVVNGAGSKTISTNLNPGTYNASIDYAGNENFTADSANTSFTVSKRTTSITASAVTATYSVSKNLVATLKDKTGKAISGVKVTIKLNGKTYTKTTDKNGQVKLGVASLIPKTYTAAITFAGNDIYEKSSKNVKVVVKKATPKMTAKAKTFRVKVKVKKYAITLKTNKNKVMKNTKVTLKINKKTFTAKTNKKGVATFKITNLKKKGKFTAVIQYAGNKYYNKLTKKAKITVKK